MYIEKIELKNFRNYNDLELGFNKNVNLILGNNAQGKTNLLEAIYISAIGRSFRTSHDSDLIRFSEQNSFIKVYAKKDYLDTSVEIILIDKGKSGSLTEKYIKKDKKSISRSSELLNNILIVIFSPEDLKIVKDEPDKRRKFIDRELSQISAKYFSTYSSYKKALIQRNAFLKEEPYDHEVLDILDSQLSKYGSDVMIMRSEFVEKISSISSNIHAGITGNSEKLEITYQPCIKLAENQEKVFYESLKKAFSSDSRNRTTTIGPHRDDISFFVNGIDMRSFGSQGQQRTCALSLKLAELTLIKEETGEDAILLLDDVMSELDFSRQEYLIDTMKSNQLFITTTQIDESILEKFTDASIFNIENGKIKEQ